jgi:hypothetical protein
VLACSLWRSRSLGTGLVMLVAAGGLLLAPAIAEEPEGDQVEITESAIFVSSATDVLPRLLLAGVPPTILCSLITSQFGQNGIDMSPCGELVALEDEAGLGADGDDPGVRDTIAREAEGAVDGSDASLPVQPLAPDTVAVSYLAGGPHYQSAIRFELPPPPAGEEYVHLELILPQGQPSYSLDSPAFRRIMLELLLGVGDRSRFDQGQPPPFFAGLMEAFTSDDQDAIETRVDASAVWEKIGVEACPFTAAFPPGGAPQAAPDSAMPQDETSGFGGPAIDCILGTTARYDPDIASWRFDLTFAAQAWDRGELDNFGLLLQPIGTQNSAIGEPDTSHNAQLVLELSGARLVTATAEPFVPRTDFGTQGPSGPPPDPFVGSPLDLGAAPIAAPALPVSQPDPAPPATIAPRADTPRATPVAAVAFSTPLWTWLFIPLLLGGSGLVASALLSTAVPAVGSSGAMTRLISRNGTPT